MAKAYQTPFSRTTTPNLRIRIGSHYVRLGRARELARQIVLGMGKEGGRASRENIARAL